MSLPVVLGSASLGPISGPKTTGLKGNLPHHLPADAWGHSCGADGSLGPQRQHDTEPLLLLGKLTQSSAPLPS